MLGHHPYEHLDLTEQTWLGKVVSECACIHTFMTTWCMCKYWMNCCCRPQPTDWQTWSYSTVVMLHLNQPVTMYLTLNCVITFAKYNFVYFHFHAAICGPSHEAIPSLGLHPDISKSSLSLSDLCFYRNFQFHFLSSILSGQHSCVTCILYQLIVSMSTAFCLFPYAVTLYHVQQTYS